MPARSPEDWVRVGQIVGPHGLKGHLKVQPSTDFLNRFAKGAVLRLNGESVTIETASIHKGRPLIKLVGYDSINAVEPLKWAYLEADGVPTLDEDEFFLEDLIGLQVVTREGESLGVVEIVESYPAHEVLTVAEIQIPIIREFVDDIDLDAKVITVNLIPGMRPGEDGA